MTSCSVLCFLLLLFQILVIIQTTCASKTCPPSSCGDITNISDPFRLKDDPPTCGNPAYELTCVENRTLLLSLFPGKNYYVKAINYNNFTVRVVDPGIHDHEGDCSSIPRYFLSEPNFTTTSPYYYRDASYFSDKYVNYLKCSNPVKDDLQYVDTAPCNLLNNSKGHLYAVYGDLSAWDLKLDCHVKLVAATSLIIDSTYMPNQNFSYQEIHRMLVYGFEVSIRGWSGVNGRQINLLTLFNMVLYNIIVGFFQGLAQAAVPLLKAMGVARGYDATKPNESLYVEFILQYEIARVTGKYVLPSYILVRLMVGLIVLFGNWAYTYRTRHTSIYENIEDFLQGNSFIPIRYSYKEIKNMTRCFKDKLGEGGYGTVYKGKLRSGPLVAVKMLGKSKANGQDFINEVATIGRIHHGNVVQLIGFCAEASKRALIYEFMPSGSLDRYISSKEDGISLTYSQMYTISLGVARGIAYLHQGCDMQILHFDIKPHNILLDENFIPKVSDFGLAKLYPIDNSIVKLTAARGTIGYMAPELFYQNVGGVSYKADVYSFGMLLMEMANRRRNLNPYADNSSQIFLPIWIYDQLIEEREIEIGEVTYKEKNDVKKMFIVALWCIQLRPDDRPSMNKVIEMLEGEVESIIMPPKPSLYPTEIIQDPSNNYDEFISGYTSGTMCFLEETIEGPLLKDSS